MNSTHHQGDVHAFHSSVDAHGEVVDMPAHVHPPQTQNDHSLSPTSSSFVIENGDKKASR